MENTKSIYNYTNESVIAITNALKIKPDDKIISICSCGAQPLSLIENLNGNGSMLSIDWNPHQIDFTKMVINYIKKNNLKKLKELNLTPKDKDYFLNEGRLRRIKTNLKKLEFKVMDISKEKIKINKKFNKAYFSNADVNLESIYPIIEKDGIIYITFGSIHLPESIERFKRNVGSNYRKDLWELYEVDIRKTREACHIEKSKENTFYNPKTLSSLEISWTPVNINKEIISKTIKIGVAS